MKRIVSVIALFVLLVAAEQTACGSSNQSCPYAKHAQTEQMIVADANAANDPRVEYARCLLSRKKSDKEIALQIDASLDNPEAFSIDVNEQRGVIIRAGGPAGLLYGVQEWMSPSPVLGAVEGPDFKIRSATVLLMRGDTYDYVLSPYDFPWFYDRWLLTHFFDYLFENRFNTILLWTGHLFPYLVDLPEYPDATTLTAEQVRYNKEQFKWFVGECAKRNIKVLLHFYNIHISPALAKSRDIPVRYTQPNDFVSKYIPYTLKRFLAEYPTVGLYICPGEKLYKRYQPEWFRDVIFAAAKESGHNPMLLVRDWYLNADGFKKVCKGQYDNLYTETKHNIEMLVSPVPDERHLMWKGFEKGHIVNLHITSNLTPFRWGSIKFIQEMVQEWRKVGADGASAYGLSCWRWPWTLDKIDDYRGFWLKGPAGEKLVTFERDAIWLKAIGRYLWNVDREMKAEEEYWTAWLAGNFGSEEAARLILQWYYTTGPILPGLQNVTSVKSRDDYITSMAREQFVDGILAARKDRSKYRGYGYFRPFDMYFFERYKTRYNMPNLENRIALTVAEYADGLANGQEMTNVMTPDKITELLVEMAQESIDTAKDAQKAATKNKDEAGRFINDSRALSCIAQVWRHKVMAAIEKRLFERTGKDEHKELFMQNMADSVKVYEKLIALTDNIYTAAAGQITPLTWRKGIEQLKTDLEKQRRFLAVEREIRRLPDVLWVEAEDMEGIWKVNDAYPGFYGAGYRMVELFDREEKGTALKKSIDIKTPGQYTVWARGVLTGDKERPFIVEVAGKKFEPTHNEKITDEKKSVLEEFVPADEKVAPDKKSVWVWRKAGEAELKEGPAEIVVYDMGESAGCVDVILLAKDPDLVQRWSDLYKEF